MSCEDRLEVIERKLDALIDLIRGSRAQTPPSHATGPNLSLKDFAQIAGRSYSVIKRDVRVGKIRRLNGRIPRDQLKYYVS